MSYNIVMKGKSAALVSKRRDSKGKIKEKYLLGLGVMSEVEFKSFRNQVHELEQGVRVEYCMKSKRGVETSPETPRAKRPTGVMPTKIIPAPKVKKVRKARKPKRIPAHERIMWDTRPWLKSGYLSIEEQRRDVEKPVVVAPKKHWSKQQIASRVERIESDVSFSRSVVRQKENRDTSRLARYEQQRLHDEIEYHKSVVGAGTRAIEILGALKR